MSSYILTISLCDGFDVPLSGLHKHSRMTRSPLEGLYASCISDDVLRPLPDYSYVLLICLSNLFSHLLGETNGLQTLLAGTLTRQIRYSLTFKSSPFTTSPRYSNYLYVTVSLHSSLVSFPLMSPK